MTKIYEHYTFEQTPFKKELENESKCLAKSKIFCWKRLLQAYELLKLTVEFGINYRNNIDNGKFEPIYEEICEINFIKKYENIFENM